MRFKRNPSGTNEVLDGTADFYISYNPAPWGGDALLRSDNCQAETMLYLHGLWLGLNGDFRAEYEEVFPDQYACLAIYEKHKVDHRSSWSTDSVEEDDHKEWLRRRLENIASREA